MPEGELILEVEEMLLMYTMTYPTTSASEFGKAVVKNFQEHPFPDFIKLSGPYNSVYEEGIKSYVVIEIEKGKEDEAFKIFNTRIANYLPVPGYGQKLEILTTMEESLSLVGLEAPWNQV
jgi:hypothetical protein